MKPLSVILFFLLCAVTVSAQTQLDTVPAYKKDPHIPAFNILQSDSTWFTKEQLPKYDFTVIVYFSPTCSHCQFATKQIVQNMDSLKNAFFVFVSYNPLSEIKEFYEHFKLEQFPNIRVGRDPKYYVPAFYKVTQTPFMAIYNKKGLFIKAYDPGPEVSELISFLHQN